MAIITTENAFRYDGCDEKDMQVGEEVRIIKKRNRTARRWGQATLSECIPLPLARVERISKDA